MSDATAPEESSRFKAAILSAPACICVLRGPEHVFEIANAPYRELVGNRPLDGLPVRMAVPELAGQGFFEQLDLVYATGEPYRAVQAPSRLVGPDGKVRELFFTFVYQPLLDASGKPEAILAFGFDVTDHVLAQQRATELAAERDELIQQLRASLQARDEFLQIASHELKTPLTALQLSIHSTERALDNAGHRDTVVFDRFVKVRRHSQRLGHLIDALLDVFRIITERVELELHDFELVEVVNRVVHQFRDKASRAGCELRVGAAESIAITADRVRVEQILSNLLANAIKYGDGQPIDVTLSRRESTVRIEVVDHGIGIAPESLQRIFGRFERAVSVRHFGGFGLGLFIARAFAEAHGGSITATSSPGAGSTFVVELPMRAADPPSPSV